MFWDKMGRKKVPQDVDILVLGNRGSGKTSLLTSMLTGQENTADAECLKKVFEFRAADERTKDTIAESMKKIEEMFTSEGKVGVGRGIDGTDGFVDYKFRLSFCDEKVPDFQLVFHDYAGSILAAEEDKERDFAKLQETFQKAQIVCILVDATYLMEGRESTFRKYSALERIAPLFEAAGADGGGKLVVMIPTKCELYVRQNRMPEVVNMMRVKLKGILEAIRQQNEGKRSNLYILPVQTLGGIEFANMQEVGDEQVATFRRTGPDSVYQPRNADILLMFFVNCLFDWFETSILRDISKRKRKMVLRELSFLDEDKLLGGSIQKYHSLQKESSREEAQEEEQERLFKEITAQFFSSYSQRESKLRRACQNENITKFYDIYMARQEIEKLFGKKFRKEFIMLPL